MGLMREKRTARRVGLKRNDTKWAYLMLSPALILLLLFTILPFVYAVRQSFFDWTFYLEPKFVGLDNFINILKTKAFRTSIKNALRFVVTMVPLGMVTTFLYGFAITKIPKKVGDFCKSATYLPSVASSVVMSTTVLFVLNYRAGLLNELIVALGGHRLTFLTKPVQANISLILISTWLGLGGGCIMHFAGLISIPPEFYEAASMDGANGLQKLIYITLPQMKNIFVLQCINLTCGTLQMLDMPMFLTGGGPLDSTLTPMLYIYQNYTKQDVTMGATIAGSLMLMVFISIVNGFVFKIIRSEKSIEG